ncbi:hypothetical protein [Sulfitobacter sediminilitoris]|uniref:hypothetical protein n=1 Tax=Sulfitobacter sediminilitoris TaxID=2698830 RepID=UPI0036172838
MTDDETLRVYAHKAAEYEEVTGRAAAEDPLLAKFISELPPDRMCSIWGAGRAFVHLPSLRRATG